MEYRRIPALDEEVSRVGIGTWAMGGVHWGGTDPGEAIEAIHAGLDRGVNLIDTAPVYGFGLSEEIVGSAIRIHEMSREDVVLATGTGLEWRQDAPASDAFWRNCAPDRIREEIESSLLRMQTNYVDIYQVHWPDPDTPIPEIAAEMNKLKKEGKIRAVGVSHFSTDQMETFSEEGCELDTCHPVYNLFEPGSGEEVLPYCRERDIYTITCSVLCRGLLSGKMSKDREFPGDDVRNRDPRFRSPRFEQYLDAVRKLDEFARSRYGKQVSHLAARWALDSGADTVLWGLRAPEQAEPFEEIDGWSLTEEDLDRISSIFRETVDDPVSVEEGRPVPPAGPDEC